MLKRLIKNCVNKIYKILYTSTFTFANYQIIADRYSEIRKNVPLLTHFITTKSLNF